MITSFRAASREDASAIVGLLSDDPLGSKREKMEDPLPDSYFDAFEAIDRDPNNALIVAENDGQVIGVVQITFIPNMSYQGTWRAQIEGVRVHKQHRGKGLGHQLLQHAIEMSRRRNCGIVQLTADKSRQDALRFYEELGFQVTHEGLKLWL